MTAGLQISSSVRKHSRFRSKNASKFQLAVQLWWRGRSEINSNQMAGVGGGGGPRVKPMTRLLRLSCLGVLAVRSAARQGEARAAAAYLNCYDRSNIEHASASRLLNTWRRGWYF